MNNPEIFVLIVIAAITHAMFQLSVSVLTVMSGHSFGRGANHRRVLHLTLGFITGTAVATLGLLSLVATSARSLFDNDLPLVVWAGVSGLTIGIGIAVWIFYFRSQKDGTALWLPRSFAVYLGDRAKKTKNPIESIGIGIVSVIGELLFLAAPMTIAALLALRLDQEVQFIAISTYTVIACLPLMVIMALVGGGRSLARIQKWRETNKRFLQFSSGALLIVLGIYTYVSMVINEITTQKGVL